MGRNQPPGSSDYSSVDCTVAREALSAWLDGEALGVAPSELEQHLAGCVDCRVWRDGAHIVTRRMRLAPAEAAPAPSAALLAAGREGARDDRWRPTAQTKARLALAAVALAQIALTVPQLLLGSDHEAPIHVAHEMGSFDMALAVGFLVAAWQPVRARGMHVLVGAAALLLVVTAFIDLLGGRTSPSDETPHLLAVAGWMLMYRVAVLTPPSEDSARMSLGFPRRSQTLELGPPAWPDAGERHLGADAHAQADEARSAAG